MIREAQLRLTYALLRLPVQIAAHFHIPMRTLAELTRLSYVEVLRGQGARQNEIARRMGQTDRHLRSLTQRLRGDFLVSEPEVGAVRQVEAHVAACQPLESQIGGLVEGLSAIETERAVAVLLGERRIERGPDGRLVIGEDYRALTRPLFAQHLEALQPLLDTLRDVVHQRLVRDDAGAALLTTLVFEGDPEQLATFLQRIEAAVQHEVAGFEAAAKGMSHRARRLSLGLLVAPRE